MPCPMRKASVGVGLVVGCVPAPVGARALAAEGACPGRGLHKGAWDSPWYAAFEAFPEPPTSFPSSFVLHVVSLLLFCKVYF